MNKNFNKHNSKDRKLYVCGDIHGEFISFVWDIVIRRKLTNADVIVAGDIGMGFYKLGYYIDTFANMEKRLKKADVHVWFVRGNHDNPEYFMNPPEELANFEHVSLVRDFSVLKLCGHKILCVGGAVSVDRKYRVLNESWWEFEWVLPYMQMETIDVDIVVTHCAPMFCPPKYERISWMDDDMDIQARNDRIQHAEMYLELIEKGNPLKYWFYGHYHNHYICDLENDPAEFTDYSKALLVNGTVLPQREDVSEDSGICTFIGLGMIKKNMTDMYEVV